MSQLKVIYKEVIYYYTRRSYQEVILLPGDPIKRRLQSAIGHLSRGDLLRGLFYRPLYSGLFYSGLSNWIEPLWTAVPLELLRGDSTVTSPTEASPIQASLLVY